MWDRFPTCQPIIKSVRAPIGDWSIFFGEITYFADQRQAENMDLSVRREGVCILAGGSPAWEGSLAQ